MVGRSPIDITATTVDSNATVTIGGAVATSGVAKSVALALGSNTVRIVVTAPDTITTKTYNLSLYYSPALPGPKSKLAFVTQPAGAVAGVVFTTQPRVAIEDAAGIQTADTDTVALAKKIGPGNLTCAPQAAVAGRATFSGCKVDQPGTYILTATSGTLTAADSTSVIVIAQPARASVTASPSVAGATDVTYTVTFTAPVMIPAGGRISVQMTGFSFTGTPTPTFTAPAVFPATATFASDTLTVTTPSAILPGIVTFTVPDGINPAAQPAKTNVEMRVTSSAGTVLASISDGTMPAIVDPGLTRVTISAFPLTEGAATEVGVSFDTPNSLGAGDTITVTMIGYEFTAGAVTITPDKGFALKTTGSLSGAVAPGATGTVVITLREGQSVAAGAVELMFPATNPAAGMIGRAALTVATSRNRTAVSSSQAISITAAPFLVVSLAGPSEVSTNGTFSLAATVTGLGGETPTYSWTATCAWAVATLPGLTASRISLSVPSDVGGSDCSFTVNVGAPSSGRSASASFLTRITTPQPRLEFINQPVPSTGSTAHINVSVRVLKADGTPDTSFTGPVALSAKSSGTESALGSAPASAGAATFIREWNPSLADATWALEATANGYTSATSDGFRVTKPKYLQFTTQPSGGTPATVFTTQPQVTAYNADGTLDTSFTGTVSLTLKSDTAKGATLTSTSIAAIAGVATFSDVAINNAGSDYVLVASSTGYAAVASEPTGVPAPAVEIVITQYTATGVAGQGTSFEVWAEARDAAGRVVPSAAAELRLLVNDIDREATSIVPVNVRLENGRALFTRTYRFPRGGNYRWGVDAIGTGLPQANTEAFLVTGAPAKLAFVQQPDGFGSVLGQQPIVEIQDADGNRIPGATNEVTLTFSTASTSQDWVMSGDTVAAAAGRATFTGVGFTQGSGTGDFVLTAESPGSGLTGAQSESFGQAGPATKLLITSEVQTLLEAGTRFHLTVAAVDSADRVNRATTGSVALTLESGDVGSPKGFTSVALVEGVATFTGLFFSQAAAPAGRIVASSTGLSSTLTPNITVTAPTRPSAIVFDTQPKAEASGVEFRDQPRARLVDANGATFVPRSASTVTISLGKTGGTTTSALRGTTTVWVTSDIVTWTNLKITGTDTGLSLTATWSGDSTVTGTTLSTFQIVTDAASAAVIKARLEISPSVPDSRKLPITTYVIDATPLSVCAFIQTVLCERLDALVATSSSSVVIEDGSVRLLTVANVDAVDEETIVRIGPVNLAAFQAAEGAAAPTGTTALYAVGRIAFDGYGNRLETLPAARSFSVPVPESFVLLGTRPGDLKVAWWDGTRWAQVPSRTSVSPDGTFAVTATTDALGVFAVLYAPGAGRIQGFGGFSTEGAGLGVFAGGDVATLANAAGLNDADGVWVQDAAGNYRLLVVGGPAFLGDEFSPNFADGIGPSTAVTLMQTRTALAAAGTAATATTSTTSYTVTGTDTLSGIGARFGVPWMRIAEANGITGPNYVVRSGQTLTIPR